MTGLWTAVAAILIFCILIFVHELGHFLAAKGLGVRVHEFAIGMGPKIFGKRKGETLYSVRLFPIGGFCALEGEDKSSEDDKALSNKPAWVKLIITVAGAFMNVLLGLLLLFLLYGSMKTVVVPEIATVAPASMAEAAGMLPGDTVIRFNGKRINTVRDIYWEKDQWTKGNAEIVVKRGGEKLSLTLSPNEQVEQNILGITLQKKDNSFWLTVKNGFCDTAFYGKVILSSFVDLIQGKIAFSSMSGPVGIVSEIGTAVEETAQNGWEGFMNLLQLTILLTINLGVFNLLPIPALDGGRIFFILVEMIRRKPLPPEKEGMVHLIGFALLILLSIVIAYMDVLKLFVK
ncbi:MAG: peptidase [Ruminococcaceae bacterium]|nr:peptidase [Oscillospiraceae bacterium]